MGRWGIVLCVALAGCSASLPWTRGEQALMGVSIACNAMDYAQTEWAMENGYREMSPLMGDAPTDERLVTTKVATQVLVYALADASENRALTLALTLVPCLAIVGHNYSQGARP